MQTFISGDSKFSIFFRLVSTLDHFQILIALNQILVQGSDGRGTFCILFLYLVQLL